ncbi:hypothetical protein D3C86_1398270 [compost metagenome]
MEGLTGDERPYFVYEAVLRRIYRHTDITKLSSALEHLLHTLPIVNDRAHRDKDEIKGLAPALGLNINIFKLFRNNLHLVSGKAGDVFFQQFDKRGRCLYGGHTGPSLRKRY